MIGEWGFDGYITADCDADADAYFAHHFTKTPEEAVKAILQAGTDIDCGGFIGYIAKSALDKHIITEEDINERLRNAFRVRMRLNHFDPVGPLDDIPISEICSEASLDAAREGSRQVRIDRKYSRCEIGSLQHCEDASKELDR
jgi:beta-glucosidase-like glycosyl hydrolase